MIFAPLVLKLALRAATLTFLASFLSSFGSALVSTCGAYVPLSSTPKLIHFRIRAPFSLALFLSRVSTIPVAMRSAVALASWASAVVIAGSTGAVSRSTSTVSGASSSPTTASAASIAGPASDVRPSEPSVSSKPSSVVVTNASTGSRSSERARRSMLRATDSTSKLTLGSTLAPRSAVRAPAITRSTVVPERPTPSAASTRASASTWRSMSSNGTWSGPSGVFSWIAPSPTERYSSATRSTASSRVRPASSMLPTRTPGRIRPVYCWS